ARLSGRSLRRDAAEAGRGGGVPRSLGEAVTRLRPEPGPHPCVVSGRRDRQTPMADARAIVDGLFVTDADGPRLLTARCPACGKPHFPAGPVGPYRAADGLRQARR